MAPRLVGAGFSRSRAATAAGLRIHGADYRQLRRLKTGAYIVALLFLLCFSLSGMEKEPLQEYKARRERVASKVNGGVIVLFGTQNQDLVKFQQEPNFYYLTGFDEPDAILVIDASSRPEHDYLFLKARDPSQERWTGIKLGPGSDTEKLTGMYSAL